MELSEYERYGRQMIVPGVGLEGQIRLKAGKVLVVGAGGLGCPAIAYLAGAGIGKLGIVDKDVVELSNLHRQILHTEIGRSKAESAGDYARKLNPTIEVLVWPMALDPDNALDIVAQFDVVLDCTDSPVSRYLINDACVLSNKPLVSASALKTEGQLSVYRYGERSPCYRCLFPTPIPPEFVGSCGENGIVGPVVGIMGVYQAIEAMKVVMGTPIEPNLALFSMFNFPQWRQVKLRRRQRDCAICSDNASITSLKDTDYVEFCEGPINGDIYLDRRSWMISPPPMPVTPRITATELRDILDNDTSRYYLLDVRPPVQFNMCALPNFRNIPLDKLELVRHPGKLPFRHRTVICICRYGNDSKAAADKLTILGFRAVDVIGGLQSWSEIDPTFPKY